MFESICFSLPVRVRRIITFDVILYRSCQGLEEGQPPKSCNDHRGPYIIKEELERFPRPINTNRGEPFGDNHPAKLLLREDVKACQHLEMKPVLLHQTRSEYKAFSLKTFLQYIYQEKRHRKELPMRVSRRNKKAQDKHDKEVKENTIWNAHNDVEDDEKQRRSVGGVLR